MAKRYVELWDKASYPNGPLCIMECEGGKAHFKRNVALAVRFHREEGYRIKTVYRKPKEVR